MRFDLTKPQRDLLVEIIDHYLEGHGKQHTIHMLGPTSWGRLKRARYRLVYKERERQR